MIMNIEKALDEFLVEQKANGNRPRTIGTYRQRITKLIRWLKNNGHSLSLDRCSRPVINKYVAWLRTNDTRHADNPYRPTITGTLSPKSIRGHIVAIQIFFSWCVDLEYIHKSPAKHLNKPKITPGKKQKMMSYKDYIHLKPLVLEMIKSDQLEEIRDAAMWLMVADSACRSGELTSMSNSTCNQSAGLNLWKSYIHQSKTNNGWVYYTNSTYDAVNRWMEVRPVLDHRYLWCGLNSRSYGQPLLTGGVYQAFERIAIRGGVSRNFSPHALRHLNGWWYTKHYGVVVAQHKLRHKSHTVTGMFYSNVDDEEVIEFTRRGSLVG